MASKYYNPRLASIAGAAQGKPYVSATPGIEKAFAKFDRVLETKRREKIQQQKENNKELGNIYYTNQKFLQNLNKEGKNIPEKHKSGLLQGYAGQLKKITMDSKDPNMARADSLILQQTALSNLNKIDNSYKKISDALKPTAELIENKKFDADLVDPEILKNFKKLVEGNWVVDSYGDDGYEKIKFEGSDEAMDINDAIESASLIPDQSELHSTITNNMINASEEFQKGNYPIEVFKDKINNEILSGPLDYKTALSLAGKIGLGGEDNIDLKRLALASREDNDFSYEDVEIDEEGNFQSTGKIISGEDGLIEAVKDHYRKTAANYAKQFENQRIEEEKIDDSKDPSPTESDKKRAITYDNAFRKSTDISKFKKELGIPTNEAGIAIGDLQSIEPKAKLDITSDNFSNLVNKLGFRVSAIYRADKDDANSEIQSIELKEQGGTGVYEVVPEQNSIQFLKGIFRMQGVNEKDLPRLINNVLYGTFNKPENDKYSQYIKK